MSKFDEFDLDVKQEQFSAYITTVTSTIYCQTFDCETLFNCDTPSFSCSGGGPCSSMGRGIARC